jgi:hypothetical protein
MGYFNIEGADTETGDARVVQVLAISEADAEEQAAKMGLVVSGIFPAIANSHSSNKLPSPSRRMPPEIPEYKGLIVAGKVCFIVAILNYALAIFALVTGLFGAPQIIFWCAALAVSGAISHGISAACVALRDIARNSFRA